MENERSDKSSDEPNAKRQKIESAGSTSAKPETKEPFLTLPSDIFAKIIGYIPVAQWPSLELLDTNFRATTLIAYRQLRNVNLQRDFITKSGNAEDESSIGNSVELILHKLVERSPFLSSLGGIHLRADAVPFIAQFEHLQTISLGDVQYFTGQEGIQLENVVALLESTRSRTSLKELRLYNVEQRRGHRAAILDRFATSFINGRHIQSPPLKLEKFSFASSDGSLRIRLDTVDTTRLTDVRLGNASIEPQQLTNLIERASELRRIELSFLDCGYPACNNPRLQANKQLLTAVASRENLTALKVDSVNSTHCVCMNFVPEFIQMLKTVGQRGQLRKLAIEDKLFDHASTINLDEICATISAYLQCLRSIKLHIGGISYGNVFSIVGMPELEDVDLLHYRIPLMANVIKKIAQLPRLKRLALLRLRLGQDANSYKSLADVTTMKDLRIGDASGINVDVWEKWSDGFGSNLDCIMVNGVHNEHGLMRLLEKAACLRVLILRGHITDQSLMVIAKSCPNLETLGVKSTYSNGISVRCLREVVNRCPKLNRLGGFTSSKISSLRLEKFHRKIVRDLDMEFWKYDFEDVYE